MGGFFIYQSPEIKQEEIDIDIYLPHYSNIGLPIEEIKNYSISIEGFNVPKIEVLLILKQHVFNERQGTVKGGKDRLDILSLLKLKEINWNQYKELLEKFKLVEFRRELINLLKQTKDAPELGLNECAMAKLRKRVSETLRVPIS